MYQELSKGLAGSKYHATIVRFRDVNVQMDGRVPVRQLRLNMLVKLSGRNKSESVMNM